MKIIFAAGAALALIVEWFLIKPTMILDSPWKTVGAVIAFIGIATFLCVKVWEAARAAGGFWKGPTRERVLAALLIAVQFIFATVIKMLILA